MEHTDRGSSRAAFIGLVTASILLLALVVLSGCGGSSQDMPAEAQLEAAKRQGEEAARERDRINSLQKQVRGLRHRAKQAPVIVVGHDSGAETVVPEHNGSAVLRTFHAPSGNVSCEILPHGALCSVASIATTFSFGNGEAAHVESGALLSEGAGELAPYGSTVSEGSITCIIPQSSDPHGVICTDSDNGHGFEASRVGARQHTY